jgi:hypothetical protein
MNRAIREDAKNELRPIALPAQGADFFARAGCNLLIKWTMRAGEFLTCNYPEL